MTISLVCKPAPIPGRINEDACLVYSDATTVIAAAIDGATQRIDIPALYAGRDQVHTSARVTGASFAAQQTKQALYAHVDRDPADMILAANTSLRERLERVAPLNAASFAELAPEHAPLLRDDPRLIRLMLPVCVATVLKVDTATHTAHFAHVGDTALFVFHKDGSILRATKDQMGQHDTAALEAALALKDELNARHLADILGHERITAINRHNGLYHNYVDKSGAPDRALGVGVVDGLPEIQPYIQTGTFDLSDIAGLLVCSDGFPLPAPWHETPQQADQRLREMRDLQFADGIDAYYSHLRRVQASDPERDRYPRFKVHDDVTGIFLALSH